jgi:hypothetical protein
MTEETTPPLTPPEKKRTMARTAQPKKVMIGDKAYDKCPFPDCGYMVEDWAYNPISGLRREIVPQPGNIYDHIKEVHKLVWLRKGKKAGWQPLSKFHPKPEEAGGGR